MSENILYASLVLMFGFIYCQRTNQCLNDNNITLRCNYIPAEVPTGIFRVQIADFVQESTDTVEEVKTSDFEPEGWNHVTHLDIISDSFDSKTTILKFNASCFENLKALKEIAIHITHAFELDNNTFLGLDKVHTLDMSNCARLNLAMLFPALNGTHKLPSLEKLIISKISYKIAGVQLGYDGQSGYDSLESKTNLKVLEISGTQIDMIRLTLQLNFTSLEVLNISYSNIENIRGTLPNVKAFARTKTLDISFAGLPLLTFWLPIGKLELTGRHYDMYAEDRLKLAFAPQTVNVSGILPKAVNSLWVKRCTLSLKEDLDLRVHNLISKENNLKYLDFHMDCENVSFNSVISLDLSENALQFLHPSVLSCMPNMAHLDLSRNELNIMASIDFRQFQDMFMGLEYLQEINLSGNNLITTPWNLFQNNHILELIDLSYNGLTQINFTLEHADRLHTLLLHNNHIQVLDSKSISSLTNVPIAPMSRENTTKITVTFYNNPLRCSECENKPFLHWLLTTERVNTNNQHLKCYKSEDVFLDLNSAAMDHVEAICQREQVILASTVTISVFLLLIMSLVVVIYLRKRKSNKQNNVNKVISLLKLGKNQYEFAVFLSYSSGDDEFVRTSVLKQLGDILKEITGIDRTLICEGDHHLRPGFYVLDETILCIQKSAVVIVVVSNHFCHSNYCDTELSQAYNLEKPILLIFKEKVEEGRMRPVMKLLFQQNVRILFEENNGVYVLKNTWEHVGKSIIDLLVQQL